MLFLLIKNKINENDMLNMFPLLKIVKCYRRKDLLPKDLYNGPGATHCLIPYYYLAK